MKKLNRIHKKYVIDEETAGEQWLRVMRDIQELKDIVNEKK